jgi:hypothetical protein
MNDSAPPTPSSPQSHPPASSKRTVLILIALLCLGILTTTGFILWQTPTVRIAYHDWRMQHNWDKTFEEPSGESGGLTYYDTDTTYAVYQRHRQKLIELGAVEEIQYTFEHIQTATEEGSHLTRHIVNPDCEPHRIDMRGSYSTEPAPLNLTVWCYTEHAEAWRRFIEERDVPDYRARFMPDDPSSYPKITIKAQANTPPAAEPPSPGAPHAALPANDTTLGMVGRWAHEGELALIVRHEDDRVFITQPDIEGLTVEYSDAKIADGAVHYHTRMNMGDFLSGAVQNDPDTQEAAEGLQGFGISMSGLFTDLDTSADQRLRPLESGELEFHTTIHVVHKTNPGLSRQDEETLILTRVE